MMKQVHELETVTNRYALRAFVFAGLAVGAWTASSCGPVAFVANNLCSVQKGPGYFSIAPKLDLVLVEDNTGSMDVALDELKKQTPEFLNLLESQNWDYRFATVPLTVPS